MFLIVPRPYIPLCCSYVVVTVTVTPGVCSFPFYLGFSPIELWDSLSTCVHPGIACLASQASDWLGAFWASLSGVQSSMTFCKTQCDWSLVVTIRLEYLNV